MNKISIVCYFEEESMTYQTSLYKMALNVGTTGPRWMLELNLLKTLCILV